MWYLWKRCKNCKMCTICKICKMFNIFLLEIFSNFSIFVPHLIDRNIMKSKVQGPNSVSQTCSAKEFGLVIKFALQSVAQRLSNKLKTTLRPPAVSFKMKLKRPSRTFAEKGKKKIELCRLMTTLQLSYKWFFILQRGNGCCPEPLMISNYDFFLLSNFYQTVYRHTSSLSDVALSESWRILQ